MQRISKNSVHKPCRVSTFAAVLKGIFFIYCFLSFNTLCIPVCRAILMQYLSYISYTFHHLVGEITKDIATHCKTLFIKALRSFNYFFNVLKLISVIFTFYVLYNMHFRIFADCFGYFQQHGKICNVIRFRFTQKAGITQKVIDYSQQLKQPH